jgi:hypothetical protein
VFAPVTAASPIGGEAQRRQHRIHSRGDRSSTASFGRSGYEADGTLALLVGALGEGPSDNPRVSRASVARARSPGWGAAAARFAAWR